MNSNVKSHQLPKVWVLEAEHVRVVGTVVESRVAIRNPGVVAVAVVINDSSNS